MITKLSKKSTKKFGVFENIFKIACFGLKTRKKVAKIFEKIRAGRVLSGWILASSNY